MISIEDLKLLEGKAIYLDLHYGESISLQFIGTLRNVTIGENPFICRIILWHPIECFNYMRPWHGKIYNSFIYLDYIKECRPLNLIEQRAFAKQTYFSQPLTTENAKTFFYGFPNIKPYDSRRT